MRLTGWHISGFGMFSDSRVDGLSPGLTVLYGPNEAGKSTLVSYFLNILFGFTDGRSKGPQYEPLAGGNHGGKLFLRADDGDYVIERTKKGRTPTVRFPDGEVGAQEAVKTLVGGANRTLFRNVFAFSLRELEEIAALEDDSVRERIFATPTFGGGPSAREVIKALQARESELLRPRASSTINDLRRELDAASTDLRKAQAEAKSYPRAVAALEEADKEIDQITTALNAARQEATRYKTLIDVWPHWSARSGAMDELELIDIPAGIEPASRERLDQSERKVERVGEVVRERTTELDRQQTRLNRVSVDDRLLPIAAEVKKLQASITQFDSDRTRLGKLETEIKGLETRITQSLADLGPLWTRERVDDFDVSIPAKGELSRWRDDLDAADEAVEKSARQVANVQDRLTENRNDREGDEEKLATYADTPSREQIEAKDTSTRHLRVASTELLQQRERADAAEERAAAVQDVLQAVDRSPVATVPPVILFGVPSILAVSGLIAAIFGQLVAATLLFVLAVVSGIGLFLWRRSTSSGGDVVARDMQEREQQTNAETRQLLQEKEGEVLTLASALGFDGTPTGLDIEERLAEISRQRERRLAADALDELVGAGREKERAISATLDALKGEMEDYRSVAEELADRWDGWRKERDMPEPMRPELVMELIPAITGVRDLLLQQETARSEGDEIQSRIEAFEQSVANTLESAGLDSDVSGAGLVAAIDGLHRVVLADEKVREDIEGLKKGIRGARRSLDEAEAESKEAEKARDQVLSKAGVPDGPALKEALEKLGRQSELEAKIADLALLIDTETGGGSGGEAMREELASEDLSAWQAHCDAAEERVDDVQADRDEALRSHQDLRRATAAVAASSDVAEHALAVESLREDLTDAVSEWARVATARALINETLARFERKHQPRVVERAAQLFDRITDGRYPQLISSEDALTVISRSEDSVDIVDLSTGTVQQLYLCLRLALAEEFAERGTRLPLIMDDVLVNFDPERAVSVAGVISEVADRHQVLLLTCHPGTRDLMAEASPDSATIELERFAR
jgi:uncharacterized protein YhaN